VDNLGLVNEAILMVDSEVVVDPEEGPEALLDGGRGLNLVVQVLLACLNKQNPAIYLIKLLLTTYSDYMVYFSGDFNIDFSATKTSPANNRMQVAYSRTITKPLSTNG
jgi:hypothetical protein